MSADMSVPGAPRCVLVAHGTRNPRGVEVVAALADAVSTLTGATRVAFVDVLGPSPAEVLLDCPGPVVLVPAFLASGYHVHHDVPREVAESGHPDVEVTRALGPDPVLAGVMMDRLLECGWRPGDRIVLAAAGSSDERARADVVRAAAHLAARSMSTVRVGYVATAGPRVADVVAEMSAAAPGKVFVASYLLAPGLFHSRLSEAGADGVTEPLGLGRDGVHPGVVDLLADRFRRARLTLRAGAAARPQC